MVMGPHYAHRLTQTILCSFHLARFCEINQPAIFFAMFCSFPCRIAAPTHNFLLTIHSAHLDSDCFHVNRISSQYNQSFNLRSLGKRRFHRTVHSFLSLHLLFNLCCSFSLAVNPSMMFCLFFVVVLCCVYMQFSLAVFIQPIAVLFSDSSCFSMEGLSQFSVSLQYCSWRWQISHHPTIQILKKLWNHCWCRNWTHVVLLVIILVKVGNSSMVGIASHQNFGGELKHLGFWNFDVH